MEFSKQLMTITELHEQNGIPIRVLRKLVHAKGAPVIRPGSGRNAMYYIDTTKLEKFLKKAPHPRSDRRSRWPIKAISILTEKEIYERNKQRQNFVPSENLLEA